MIRFCRALHRRIVYTGRLCPLCHEIEINLELMDEIKRPRVPYVDAKEIGPAPWAESAVRT